MIRQPRDGELITWNPAFADRHSQQFKNAQKYIDSQVLRFNSKYIPFQTGNLDRSGQIGTRIGTGKVVYNAPYARYMYYGKVMRDSQGRALYGKAPKHVTDEELTYHGAPTRGKLWFERMKAAHKETIRKGAQRYLRG